MATLEQLIAAVPATQAKLVLPVGFQGGGYVRNIARATPLVVTGDPTAMLTQVQLQNSDNIVFEDLKFKTMTAGVAALAINAGTDPVTGKISGSDNCGARRCDFSGPAMGTGNGVNFRGCTGGFVEDSTIHHLSGGINVLNTPGVTVARNVFHDLTVDGCQVSGSSRFKFIGNYGYDFYPANPQTHPDFLQLMTVNQTVAMDDVQVLDNVFERGKGVLTYVDAATGQTKTLVPQGIFFSNEANLPFQNVLIQGNAVFGALYRGLSPGPCQVLKVLDNFVQGCTDMGSSIYMDYARQAVLDGNVGVVNIANSDPGLVATNQKSVPIAKPGDRTELLKWLATHPKAGNGKVPGTVAPTPTPIPTPTPTPVPDPQIAVLQAQVAALTTERDALKVQVANLQLTEQAAQVALTATKTEITRLQGLLDQAKTLTFQLEAIVSQ